MIRAGGLALLIAVSPASLAQQSYQPPRTADGKPDLQGNWTNRILAPLERPAEAKSLALTAAEAAKLYALLDERSRNANPGASEASRDITGLIVVASETRSSQLLDPSDGKLPYTEAGRARRDKFVIGASAAGPEDRWHNERCTGTGGGLGASPMIILPVGNIRQIVQTPDAVLIHTEAFSLLRIIPLDGRSALGVKGETTRGRWEGDTLVIETTGLHPDDQFRRGISTIFPVSPATRVTERLTRIAHDELLYRYTVEDSVLYKQPWTAEWSLKLTTEKLYEFACHEGNYSLSNILLGARITEDRMPKAGRAR
jgi:hypothetical protein